MTENWQELYERESPRDDPEKVTKAYNERDLPTTQRAVGDKEWLTEIGRKMNFTSLAKDYLTDDSYCTRDTYSNREDVPEETVDDVSEEEIQRYVVDMEKGEVVPDLSRAIGAFNALEGLVEEYGKNKDTIRTSILEDLDSLNDFYDDLLSEYEVTADQNDQEIDTARIRKDLAIGGRTWSNILTETTSTVSRYIENELMPELFSEVSNEVKMSTITEYIDSRLNAIDMSTEVNIESSYDEEINQIWTTIENIEAEIEHIDLTEINRTLNAIQQDVRENSANINSVERRVDELENGLEDKADQSELESLVEGMTERRRENIENIDMDERNDDVVTETRSNIDTTGNILDNREDDKNSLLESIRQKLGGM